MAEAEQSRGVQWARGESGCLLLARSEGVLKEARGGETGEGQSPSSFWPETC